MISYKRYERQLNFVESMVEFHPESLDIFTPKELALFRQYFLPNWNVVKDYKAYLKELTVNNPQIRFEAEALLQKYLVAYNVHHTDLL